MKGTQYYLVKIERMQMILSSNALFIIKLHDLFSPMLEIDFIL
jgi:hypothetical protein